MNTNIRPLTEADIPTVVDFSIRAWTPVDASFHDVLGDPTYAAVYPDWTASQARDMENICRDEAADVWVAEENGAPVAFVAVVYDRDAKSGEIDMIAVDPDFQRRGLATALTATALESIRDSGAQLAIVATGGDIGHAPARRTYEKAGFIGLPLVRYYMRLD